MWVIAKINTNEFSLFKNSINNANGSITEIYFPKILQIRNKQQKDGERLGDTAND